MSATVRWIEGPRAGRLAVSPHPHGGDSLEAEVRAWSESGVDVVVSLLTPDEVGYLALTEESQFCRAFNISFISFSIEDRMVPSSNEAAFNLINKVGCLLDQGRSIVIHCWGGIGRSGLIASCVMVRGGMQPEEAMRRAGLARGIPVPETAEQVRWVRDYADIDAQQTQSDILLTEN